MIFSNMEKIRGSQVKVSEKEMREDIRKAVYDLIWQTAHLYKDAPGGKLACPQRSKLERYVDSKMMIFDFMLENANNKSEFKEVIENCLKDLEDNLQTHVYEGTKSFSFYRERKRDCLDVISTCIPDH
jgi:hypothetical protein